MSSKLSQLALAFGKCVTSDVPSAVKVCVDRQVLDERLLMYFKEKFMYYAHDPTGQCQPGDYVLIRKNDVDQKQITHTVEKLVYKMGNFVDPLTGRKCAGTEYIDEMERISALFGKKLPFLSSEFTNQPNADVDSQAEADPSISTSRTSSSRPAGK